MAEEMKEGTSFFTVTASLPVAESFGFADGMKILTFWKAGVIDWLSALDFHPQISESELRELRAPN